MISIERTNSKDLHFQELVKELDQYLAKLDGEEHDFYDQYNKIDTLNHVVIVYLDDQPVGCGAFKEFDPKKSVEIKRMYTNPNQRGKGIAKQVLKALEEWAVELGYSQVILETGKRMPDAIGLYEKCGYTKTEPYGQYIGIENSQCFSKSIA